ncbi:transcription antitermination factor NusB [Corynebacterium pacaense]|uniref:transcription antitermination factor NusB n=1 Tax=Corynebacterium pacaense TaxID=1816684 RepID=UPI0009B9BC38|nr:transcription antitermination factor NusB [Corynebacterium pacaense]
MSERLKGHKRHGSRYKARRRAVDILFEAESRDVDPVAIIDDRRALSVGTDAAVAPVAEYTATIVEGVAVELDGIDTILDEHISDTWTLNRLPSVDRAILRVAAWEMLFNHEVPVPTTVVEAVEIASEYSTDNSSAYINATLDAMASKVDQLRDRAANPHATSPAEDTSAPPAPWDDSLDEEEPDLHPHGDEPNTGAPGERP